MSIMSKICADADNKVKDEWVKEFQEILDDKDISDIEKFAKLRLLCNSINEFQFSE